MTQRRRSDERASGSDDRAVSPVVGTALLLGITVILATVIGTVVLDVGVGSADAPQVTLSFSVADDGGDQVVELHHEGGEPLVAEEIVVRTEQGDEYDLSSDRLVTGERTVMVNDTGDAIGPDDVERVTVVWQDPRGSTESVLGTFRP
ncbi:type IV pilin [Halopenitus persicus]|uniref:type IV pilin n=1 Tax=Halopenitus persicus TaxID=1048396 RepID=UPI000BBAAF79|nr:type IV pilin N-terminal domain-containing protein [Halopenitus persicus]